MTTTFPDAPDFNVGSQPWRRTAEETIKNLETEVAILTKNLRAYQRSTVAGTKATNLKISQLQGTNIPPGTPINVEVYPYAYFTSSGYPAAGARVYWGDQNDADHYEIWVRKVTGEGDPLMADTQQASVTKIATADIRGLEVRTDYELMIRAISYGGSYGFFTGTVPFTTPDELTQIGPFGGPNVWYSNGFGIVEWRTPEWEEEPSTEYATDIALSTVGAGLDRPSTSAAVLHPNGNIYHPPGMSDGGATPTSGELLTPTTTTTYNTDFGLSIDARGRQVGEGAVGDDERIYWSCSDDGTGLASGIIRLETVSATAEVLSIGSGANIVWPSLVRAGDNRIYGSPTEDRGFLIIDTLGSPTEDTLGVTIAPGELYGPGVADASGNVWFMPQGTTSTFLKIDTTGGGASVSKIPLTYAGWDEGGGNSLVGPVLYTDGSIYAFGRTSSGGTSWYRIGADGTQEYGAYSAARGVGHSAIGADGRIYIFGAPNNTRNTFAAFDTTTRAFSSYWWPPVSGVEFNTYMTIASATTAPDSKIYLRCVEQTTGTPGAFYPTERYMVLTPDRIDHPGVPLEVPSYFKHMLVERAGSDGIWLTLGAMTTEGYFTDPTVQAGQTYDYRLTPISTAGTTGIPGPTDTLIVPEP